MAVKNILVFDLVDDQKIPIVIQETTTIERQELAEGIPMPLPVLDGVDAEIGEVILQNAIDNQLFSALSNNEYKDIILKSSYSNLQELKNAISASIDAFILANSGTVYPVPFDEVEY